MALPATGGAAAAAMAWNMAAAGASAGQPQPQQQQSYLALPPSTTAGSDTLAGFIHLPSAKAAGTARPGERLLWARITMPVPGVIPPPPSPQAALAGEEAEDGAHDSAGEDRPRLPGRLWPCLVYFGGCVEVLKELDPKSGEFFFKRVPKPKKKRHMMCMFVLATFCPNQSSRIFHGIGRRLELIYIHRQRIGMRSVLPFVCPDVQGVVVYLHAMRTNENQCCIASRTS